MKRTDVVLLAACVFASSCGTGTQPDRVLLSVSVTPSAAAAHDFHNGQVQFTATGTFDKPPSPVVLQQAIWQLTDPNLSGVVSISQNGVAQCTAGFTGTVVIEGGQGQCPGGSLKIPCVFVHGTAQLSCP